MSTSAINGKIVYKQGSRAYLDSTIRENSLAFDTDNNVLLYSPSGTNYYEFYPGNVTSSVYINNQQPTIFVLSGAINSTSSESVSSAATFPYWMVGYRTKLFSITGPSSGTYQANVILKGANIGDLNWSESNNISATITNSVNSVSAFYTNNSIVWSGEMIVISGNVPYPGIIAKVVG